MSNRAIAQRLGVSEMAIRKLVGSSTGEEGEQFALVSVPKAPSIEPLLIPPASMICAELRVDPSQAANEIAQESRVLEEEAHGDEPVSMSLDADAGWPATIRFSGRIASAEDVAGLPHLRCYRVGGGDCSFPGFLIDPTANETQSAAAGDGMDAPPTASMCQSGSGEATT